MTNKAILILLIIFSLPINAKNKQEIGNKEKKEKSTYVIGGLAFGLQPRYGNSDVTSQFASVKQSTKDTTSYFIDFDLNYYQNLESTDNGFGRFTNSLWGSVPNTLLGITMNLSINSVKEEETDGLKTTSENASEVFLNVFRTGLSLVHFFGSRIGSGVFTRFEGTFASTNGKKTVITTETRIASQNGYGLQGGIGYSLPLNNISLLFSANYNHVRTSELKPYTWIDIGGGVLW